MNEMFLQRGKVDLDVQGEPRLLENRLPEHGQSDFSSLILILIYVASPKGRLFLMGVSFFRGVGFRGVGLGTTLVNGK